ncbi:MAG: hypothetical protein NZM42_07705 [Gemmatales bacterium]|nr:hypothetical protein [Gemmatales bacterium]
MCTRSATRWAIPRNLLFTEGFRLTQVLDPLGNSTCYTYTNDGCLASRTDRSGRVINFAYDSQGRLITQTWLSPDGSVVDTLTYSYDADGRLLSASNYVGTYMLYETYSRLISVTNPFGITLTYSYDDSPVQAYAPVLPIPVRHYAHL